MCRIIIYNVFTYHVVNIKRWNDFVGITKLTEFTYHVVNIKPQLGLCLSFLSQEFTYHVVNIKHNKQLDQY